MGADTMTPYPRTMAAGAAVVVTAAWRRLRRRENHKPGEQSPAAAGQDAPQTGHSPDAAESSTTMTYESETIESHDRDEPADERPPLAAVPTVIDRRQHVEFFENQARANAGQWLASDDIEITEDRR